MGGGGDVCDILPTKDIMFLLDSDFLKTCDVKFFLL